LTVLRSTGVNVVLSTASSREGGEQIARRLVEEELAACVNVVPGVTSVYRWEGEVQAEPEVLLVIKVTEAGTERLLARLEEVHPYDVPEGVVLSVAAGLEAYCRWVEAEISEVTS
jgi:periplasmic divalent cation tolerance protein